MEGSRAQIIFSSCLLLTHYPVRRTASLDSQPQLDLVSESSSGRDAEPGEELSNGHSNSAGTSWLAKLWQMVNAYAPVPQQGALLAHSICHKAIILSDIFRTEFELLEQEHGVRLFI